MIKCVVSDLDGTLIHDGFLSDKNYKSIMKLKDNNINFVIATGRNCVSEKELKGQYISILLNGALIKDKEDKILYEQYLKLDELRWVVEFAKKNNCPMMLYTNDGQIAINKDKTVKAFLPMTSENEREELGLYSIKEFNIETDLSKKIYKCEIMDPFNRNKQRDLFKLLSTHNTLDITSSVCDNIEINGLNTNKMNGLRRFMSIYDYNSNEVAVFGDGLNDLCMYKKMTETFAVDNAIDDIKRLAKYQISSCAEDGFSQGVEMILKMNKGDNE